ncbi:tail fiber protein [Agrobacterium phage Atu_ph03]|uniref:Tail fiber protein n=1 Tax=Agrobacterium phage Atu_ph03 TaxID=2024262 RepID=A0A2L0UZ26_9CAUD|nr:tail fiber protein [Agrobacterium phage Atu_ph03]AUZ94787.1 tail fiber protein [Agrobacterium phage Atu_ph03]
MALSVIVVPGDGVTTQFNIPFSLGYIKESDITARVGSEVDGAGNPSYRALTFLSPEIVEVAGTPTPVGQNIVFRRTVDREQLIVDFEDGDVINEENMNTAQRQAIMLVHEVLDGRFEQFQSSFDMGGFRITGVGDPVDPQDVATKNYIDTRISTGQASAAAAAASAAAALASQNAAAASATASAGSATASLNSATVSTNARDAAIAARDSALTYRNAAEGFRNQAATSATQAEASNVSAGNAATGAGASASAAASSASQSLTFRNQAETFRNEAALSETNAGSSAAAAAQRQTYAYQWAQQVEDTQVDDGMRVGYSAYHWAAKAAASAAAAQTWDPANYVAKAGSTMTGGLTAPNMTIAQTSSGSWGALQVRTAGASNYVNYGKRHDSHAGYIQVGDTVRWEFTTAGQISLPGGGILNPDGNLFIASLGWASDVIGRTSRMRMAGAAWADVRGTDGIRDSNLGGSVVVVGLTTNAVSGDNRSVVAMFYRQLQQTNIAGNWFTIPSL